jgi:hypothetical protein
MRLLFIPIAAALLAGCHLKTAEEIARDPDMGVSSQACAAAEIAIRKDLHLPAEFGSEGFECQAVHSADNRDFTVPMRVHNSGSWQRYTFYLVRTRLTDKGAMRPVEILHQDEDAWNATKER